MLYTLRFFSSKCSLFHNANLFGSCIIYILYTVCAEIKKNNSGAKGLRVQFSNMQWYCMLVKRIFKMYVNIFKPVMEISHFIFLIHLSKPKCPFVGVFAKKLQW